MENLKTLKAMLLLAETLNYSTSYKEKLILEISYMIENEKKLKQ